MACGWRRFHVSAQCRRVAAHDLSGTSVAAEAKAPDCPFEPVSIFRTLLICTILRP